jgi:hypothetical protein
MQQSMPGGWPINLLNWRRFGLFAEKYSANAVFLE